MDSVVRLRYNYRQSESHRNSFRSSGLRRVCAMAALTASLYLTTDTLMPIEQPPPRDAAAGASHANFAGLARLAALVKGAS
jgi:hypothetical protein